MVRTGILGAALLASMGVHADTPDIRPGLWEMTVISRDRDDALSERRDVRQACIAPESTRSMHSRWLSSLREPGCRIVQAHVDAARSEIAWQCEASESRLRPASGRSSMNFRGDRVDGDLHLRVQVPGMGEAEAVGRFEGRRLGDCP